MGLLHEEAVTSLIRWGGAEPDAVIEQMEARADREDFPTVGPEVGRTLAMCVRLTGATAVLELGSGFGYSAYWIARALPPDGTIVLTEQDAGRLADAARAFEAGGLADRAQFERGDAISIADRIDDSFDLVHLDHDTADYIEGFEAVADLVEPGGAILADNVVATDGGLTADDLLATLEGDHAPTRRAECTAAYLEHVRAAPGFETYVLPVGEGLAVSARVDGAGDRLGS